MASGNDGSRPKPRHKAGQQSATTERPVASNSESEAAATPSLTDGRRFMPPPVDGSRVVSKPVPKSQSANPRDFQIQQLKRRFSAGETFGDDVSELHFHMVPSDPDFPFEMPGGLDCVLLVPGGYPLKEQTRPSLAVRNQEMGREWQLKVEGGFARLARGGMQNPTLLQMMNQLDRQLESLLTEKAYDEPSITIITNKPPKKAPESNPKAHPKTVNVPPEPPLRPSQVLDPYSSSQLHLAGERRQMETRQLEARLGRTPLYAKSSDSIAYTLPIQPRKQVDLPVPLQAIEAIKLFVPLLYPLHHCRVELQGVSREGAKPTEAAFERYVKGNKGTSLMGHVNYLAQNMHVLATEVIDDAQAANEAKEILGPVDLIESALEKKFEGLSTNEDDRAHIKVIQRPPEWGTNADDETSDDTGDSDSYDSGDEDEDGADEGGTALNSVPEETSKSGPERGISLSLPSLELYSIELLELVSLSVNIKCERCKDTVDIRNLRDKAEKTESCKKCALPLSVGYRKELMHTSSFRAGYLDLEGCTIVDMLPSSFLPTCSECSTVHPLPGVVSVRGESTMAICRECHRKMTFKIPEIKFLLVSSAAARPANRAPVRKKPKEALGITAGQELPRRGRCSHYSKSYRWFRFSCCSKVFACDRCHDEASDHSNEHANRMICGFCSREQNYRPEDCGVCHMSLVKKAGSGFWEGGKGTRDKAKMSRKGMSCGVFS